MKFIVIIKKIHVSYLTLIILLLTTSPLFSDYKSEYRGYGLADVPDYHQLIEKPHVITKIFKRDALNKFSIVTDYHILLPCPVDRLTDVLSDLDSSEDVFPRMEESKVYYRAQFPEEIFYQRIKTDFESLGVGKTYDYSVKVFFDEKKDDMLKMRWILNESYDNSFDEFSGSWYCQEVVVDDQCYTYLRNYSETVFNDAGFLTVFAVKHFTESEIKKNFKSLFIAAQ